MSIMGASCGSAVVVPSHWPVTALSVHVAYSRNGGNLKKKFGLLLIDSNYCFHFTRDPSASSVTVILRVPTKTPLRFVL
jgi:hypothetical protein